MYTIKNAIIYWSAGVARKEYGMSREQLIDRISTTLLWEILSARAEDVKQLSVILHDIGYIDNKDNIVSQVTYCEVFDSEPPRVGVVDLLMNKDILLSFEMPFLLSAWHEKNNF